MALPTQNYLTEDDAELKVLRGLFRPRDGQAPDYSKAKLEFEKRAEQGNILGMVFLGEVHMTGTGTPKNFDAAEFWLQRAANAGSARAYFHLGQLYLMKKKAQEGVEALTRSVEGGFAPAMHLLGRMYSGGHGVRRDREMGRKLLVNAYKNGSVFAKTALGMSKMRERSSILSMLGGACLWISGVAAAVKITLFEGPTSDRFK